MEIIIVLFYLIYLVRVFTIKLAASSSRKKYRKKTMCSSTLLDTLTLPFVSVIVPARNEEKNIENCINSILKSDYPTELFELVIVNDRSDDKTLEIVQGITDKLFIGTDLKPANMRSSIKICNVIAESSNPNLKGKPGAIKIGVDNASGEVLLMTDADCVVNPNWIYRTVQCFIDGKKENVAMVCSYTNVISNKMFHYFQAAEVVYMHTFACAGIELNTVLGCFGNNIAITKEAYNKIGGYESLGFSVTEDYVLLKSVFDAGFSIRYLCMEDTIVDTLPVNSFREYMVQRKRWAIGGLNLSWKAIIYVASSVALWLAIIASAIIGNCELLIISCLLRFLGDCLILFPVFDVLNIRYLKKWIPFSVCFYSIIEILLPFAIINKKVKWKGQIFNEK